MPRERFVSVGCATVLRQTLRQIAATDIRNRDFERTICAMRGLVEMVLEGRQAPVKTLLQWKSNADRFLWRERPEQRARVHALIRRCRERLRSLARHGQGLRPL